MADLGIPEAATRKLGPLPTWGWGIAIVGAIVVWKVIGGRSGGGGGTTAPEAIPTTSALDGGLTDDGGVFTGPNSIIAGLLTSVGTLSTFQQLQTQLSNLLKQQQDLYYRRSSIRIEVNAANDAKNAAKTDADKSKAQAKIDFWTGELAKNSTALDAINKSIGELQAKITGLNSAGAATSAATGAT